MLILDFIPATFEERTAAAFADKAEAEAGRRLAGDFAGDLGFAVGGLLGSPLGGMAGFTAGGFAGSMLTESILNATGFFEKDPLITLDQQSRAMVDSSVHKFAFGLGGVGMDRGISMDEASAIGNDLFDQARGAGFHGVEVSRVMDTLGQYSSKLHMSSGSADDIASQLEEYLDGVMDIVKRTGDSMERASTMIAQAKTMGVDPGNAADFFGNIADYSSIAGVNPNQMIAMGQQHSAPFASAGFGYGDIMTSFSGGMAQAGIMSANSQNAPLWAAIGGPAQYGMHQAQLGSAFVSNPRMWGKMMGDGGFDQGAWDAMRSGSEMPDSYGDAYGDLNRNDQLVAQYQGMQEVMGRSGEWTQAATGSLFQQMAEDDITDYRAQAMWLYQGGYASNIATARQDVSAFNLTRGPDYQAGLASTVASNTAASTAINNQEQFHDFLDIMSVTSGVMGDSGRRILTGDKVPSIAEALWSTDDVANGNTFAGSTDRAMSAMHSTRGFASWGGSVGDNQIDGSLDSFRNAAASMIDANGNRRISVAGLEAGVQYYTANGNDTMAAAAQELVTEDRVMVVNNGFDYTNRSIGEMARYLFPGNGSSDSSDESSNRSWIGSWMDTDTGAIDAVMGLAQRQINVQSDLAGRFFNSSTGRMFTGIATYGNSEIVRALWQSHDEQIVYGEGEIEAAEALLNQGTGDPRRFLVDYNRPTSALAMRAQETGWYDRLSVEEQTKAARFGGRFNATLEDMSLRSSMMDSGQVDAQLNTWQTTQGFDSGWSSFLENVSDERAAFVDTGDLTADYDSFAMSVYGLHTGQLSGTQSQYINTYLGAGGAADIPTENSLMAQLAEMSGRNVSNREYQGTMMNLRRVTGLGNESINDIALYGVYRGQSSQLTAEIANATGSEKARLIDQKSEYDEAMNQMTLNDPTLQRSYNSYYGNIAATIGDNDMLLRVAGGDTLDEQMARGSDVFNRASGQAREITGGKTIEEFRSMSLSDRKAFFADKDIDAYGTEMEAVINQLISSEDTVGLNDLLELQDLADMNPDTPANETATSTDGKTEEGATWSNLTAATINAIGKAVAAGSKGLGGEEAGWAVATGAENPEETETR